MTADDFLALIGKGGLSPPPIPPRLVPKLVSLGLGHPAITEAWGLCFWAGWWGGFIVGALVAAIVFLVLFASLLALGCFALWLSNRRSDHEICPAPPDPRAALSLGHALLGASPR